MMATKEVQLLPDSKELQKTCKAMAVLDAIICQDWVYRYSSYNSNWSEDEEFYEMRNGEGDGLLILFKKEGTVINGYFTETTQPDKTQLRKELPEVFHEFIFGEPVNSAGTQCCLWKTEGMPWISGISAAEVSHSNELLNLLDGKPETYLKWANTYFKGLYKNEEIDPGVVQQVYQQQVLNREMVLTLVAQPEDWDQLAEDLDEIGYLHQL